ncbi:MAG: TonB family protein [Cyclobacteriaceae bacterium]|nr:TonB family protein [Cyclobacteriaceae bacterium]
MTDYSHDIKRYLSGDMTPAEKHAFEKLALSDPFLAEALEGAEELPVNEFLQDINTLNRQISGFQLEDQEDLSHKHSKLKSHNKRKGISVWGWTMRIAAGIVLIMFSAYIVILISEPLEEKTPLALESNPAAHQPVQADSSGGDEMLEDKVQENLPIEPSKAIAAKPSPPSPSKTSYHLEDVEMEENSAAEQTHPSGVPHQQDEKTEVALSAVEGETIKNEPVKTINAESTAKKQAVSRSSNATITPANVIRGKVTAADDGSTLPGVNVIIKGTTHGTVTNETGDYQLNTTDQNLVLVFSFIGMKSKEVNAQNQDTANIELETDAAELSEVVVTGMAVQSERKALGYAVSAADDQSSGTFDLAAPSTGSKAFKQYLESSILYPEEAKTKKVEGRVTVDFFVETDGTLTDFSLIKGIGAGCDEELIRLIKSGPKWTPSKKDGTPIRDKARVRLKFELPK